MAKKLDPVEKHSHDTSSLYGQNLRLEARAWRGFIDEKKFLEIISLSLNACVYKNRLALHGYLITNNSVYLMAHNENKKFDIILGEFYHQVLQHLKKLRLRDVDRDYFEAVDRRNLFKKSTLYKGPISGLMMGEKVDLPYFNAKIAFLKEHIVNYNYCSAIDYSGAIGPVLIQKNYSKKKPAPEKTRGCLMFFNLFYLLSTFGRKRF